MAGGHWGQTDCLRLQIIMGSLVRNYVTRKVAGNYRNFADYTKRPNGKIYLGSQNSALHLPYAGSGEGNFSQGLDFENSSLWFFS